MSRPVGRVSVTPLPVTCHHSPSMSTELLLHFSRLLISSGLFPASGGTETELARRRRRAPVPRGDEGELGWAGRVGGASGPRGRLEPVQEVFTDTDRHPGTPAHPGTPRSSVG